MRDGPESDIVEVMSIPPFRRSGPTTTVKGWATATPGVADQLRRGAWYPVIDEQPDGLSTVLWLAPT